MRAFSLLFYLLVTAGAVAEARAAPARLAVFDIELIDMSQEGEAGVRADQTRRLALASEELRALLRASNQVEIVDLAPEAKLIERQAPLHKCNGCEEEIAKKLGADLALVGTLQKTSNLILSFAITIKDVQTGKAVKAGQVDIRGNNDEMWLRGIRWVVRNRLLAEPFPARP